MNKAFEKIIERLEETDFNDIQMVIREVLLKYGFPYESVVQDEVWNALDELSTNKFTIKIVKEVAEEYNNGWIPCSERLPEKEGKYLVTLDKWNIVSFADFKNLKYNPHFNAPVIAWQPLPEPFKEGE